MFDAIDEIQKLLIKNNWMLIKRLKKRLFDAHNEYLREKNKVIDRVSEKLDMDVKKVRTQVYFAQGIGFDEWKKDLTDLKERIIRKYNLISIREYHKNCAELYYFTTYFMLSYDGEDFIVTLNDSFCKTLRDVFEVVLKYVEDNNIMKSKNYSKMRKDFIV